jgi:outer membrane lipoprotein-sorting protein
VNPLRKLPTSRLLGVVAGVAVVAGGGAAIAGAVGGGAAPPPEPLAVAVHDALAAPALQGVTARIRFTNHLIDSSSLQRGDPLLTGASGRLWMSDQGKLRLELQSGDGDVQVLLDGRNLSVYDPSQQTVYRATLPEGLPQGAEGKGEVPTVQRIEGWLASLMQGADLSGAIPGVVAGQPAYTVRISPKHDGGLLGSAELAWDATHGVPLRAAVYAAGNPSPVLELIATDVSYGPVAASDLAVAPPAGAKVVELALPAGIGAESGRNEPRRVSGLAAVQAAVGFPVAAPPTLVGLPRRGVRLVDRDGTAAALVTYGQGLGGIAVLEAPAKPAGGASPGGERGSLFGGLPAVAIDGVTGRELDTALGTVVWFTRGGVEFTLLGSVPPVAAEAAARGLTS